MRYLIAHMITGAAGTYHRRLSTELAQQFGVRPVAERIDPHLTFKAPFEATSVADVEAVLSKVAARASHYLLTLGGFRHFDHRVVYLDVVPSTGVRGFIEEYQDELRTIPWLRFSPYEFPLTLHATLCFANRPTKSKEILSYLRHTPPTTFQHSLDSLSLLTKTGERWEVAQHFPFMN